MTNVVVDSTHKAAIRVTCVNSSSVPAGVTTITPDVTLGILRIAETTDPLLSGANGVPSKVKVVPGSVGSATYNLTIYGAMRIGGPLAHEDGPWLWVPLFRGSAAATLQYAGYESSGYMATTDYQAATVTPASNGPADLVTISYGGSVGPACVIVPTRGCPYLLVVADAASKFALVSPLS